MKKAYFRAVCPFEIGDILRTPNGAAEITDIAAILVATCIMFRIGQALAFAERGYIAYGGEYLLLLLPLFWKIGKTAVNDFCEMWAELSEDSPEWRAE